MAKLGTLFYILWFLGTSFCAGACPGSPLIPACNDNVIDIHTSFSLDFLPEHEKYVPKGVRKIVIDAGHGGHDHGCTGKLSNEKHITLEIALRLGQAIKTRYPDMEVLYTRTTDVFVPLHKRIDLANKNDADLFISIHANAFADQSVSGTEVFVMGLHTAEENLRVAQRENASVLLESDFEANYDGFDPNSPEAQIILSMYQNAYLDKSIELAKKLTDAIAESTGFINRGVKQAGFVILRKATMPSVLVEAGFLSNEQDEALLHTADGQQRVAEAMARAIGEFKAAVEQETEHMIGLQEKTSRAIDKRNRDISPGVIYRLQLGAYRQTGSERLPDFIAGEPVDVIYEQGLKKMLAGKFVDYHQAVAFQEKVRGTSSFKHAFIVAYRGVERIGLDEAGAPRFVNKIPGDN
jgi:N-acetylmuramoyl-L-alanine amidase